jgi:hypothetical protein
MTAAMHRRLSVLIMVSRGMRCSTGWGHSRAKMTDEVYTHVLPEAERRAAQIMEETILG